MSIAKLWNQRRNREGDGLDPLRPPATHPWELDLTGFTDTLMGGIRNWFPPRWASRYESL